MRKFFALAAVFLLCTAATPQGCQQIDPQTQAVIQGDLDVTCPALGTLSPAVKANFNGNVQKAYDTLLLACPPNPPPTNWATIGADVLAAALVLQPYIQAYLKAHPIKIPVSQ